MINSRTLKLPKNGNFQIESFTFEVGTYLLHETYYALWT